MNNEPFEEEMWFGNHVQLPWQIFWVCIRAIVIFSDLKKQCWDPKRILSVQTTIIFAGNLLQGQYNSHHPRNVNFELTFINLYYMCFCFGRKTNIRLLQWGRPQAPEVWVILIHEYSHTCHCACQPKQSPTAKMATIALWATIQSMETPRCAKRGLLILLKYILNMYIFHMCWLQ